MVSVLSSNDITSKSVMPGTIDVHFAHGSNKSVWHLSSLKLFVTAGLIVLITEIAKRSDKFGGMIAALPFCINLLTTLMLDIENHMVIFWMKGNRPILKAHQTMKIANHI